MRPPIIVLGVLLIAGCGGGTESPMLSDDSRTALDVVLASSVAAGDVPGVVAFVTTRDSNLYRGAAGVMDAEGEVAMRTDAIFQIASMTKPITSLGIMMLQEQGALTIDDPAADYLPELRGREVLVQVNTADSAVVTRPATREITIKNLLRHTSGFGYSFSSYELLEMARGTSIPAREHPLLHDPGTRWTYGMSTAFLGWIIEEVTEGSLREFFETRVTGPLGMVDTSFHLAPEHRERLVATYNRVDGVLQGQALLDEYQPFVRGDGGLLSTADDYARFIQLILGDGERGDTRLVSEESVAAMARDQLEGLFVVEQPGALPNLSHAFPLGAGEDGFGLGFQISGGGSPGGRASGSLSWAGIQNTHFWIDRENGIGVVLLMALLPFFDARAIDLLTSFERALYDELGIGPN